MGNAESGPADNAKEDISSRAKSNFGNTLNDDWDFTMNNGNEALLTTDDTCTSASTENNSSMPSSVESNSIVEGHHREKHKKDATKGIRTMSTDEGESTNGEKIASTLVNESAAIFQLLDNDANGQNPESTRRQSIKATAPPTKVRYEKKEKRPIKTRQEDDEISVRDQPSAVFDFLLETKASEEDKNRSSRVIQWLETQNHNDEASVISEMSHGVTIGVNNKATTGADDDSVSKYSSAIFKFLGSEDVQERDDDDVSISEYSAAIFKVLDSTQAPDVNMQTTNASSPSPRHSGSRGSVRIGRWIPGPASVDLTNLENSKNSLRKRNIFHILGERQGLTPSIPEESEVEEREDAPSVEGKDRSPGEVREPLITRRTIKKSYPQVVHADSDVSSTESELTEMPLAIFSEEIHADTSEQEAEQQIDMEFVQNFDKIFNEFIGKHPKFLMINPELVQQLRVKKLHKTLELLEDTETRLLYQLSSAKGEKQRMENTFQWNLKQASRRKAAQHIRMEAELAATHQRTKLRKAELMARIFTAAENRAKTQFHYAQRIKAKKASFKGATGIANRQEVIDLIPDPNKDESALMIKKSLFGALPNYGNEKDKVNEIRKCQVKNAFMISEIAILHKKLDAAVAASKKYSWIDSVMLRMDETTMARLNNKYAAKLGLNCA